MDPLMAMLARCPSLTTSAALQGIPERFITRLRDSKEIGSEIDAFITGIYGENNGDSVAEL